MLLEFLYLKRLVRGNKKNSAPITLWSWNLGVCFSIPTHFDLPVSLHLVRCNMQIVYIHWSIDCFVWQVINSFLIIKSFSYKEICSCDKYSFVSWKWKRDVQWFWFFFKNVIALETWEGDGCDCEGQEDVIVSGLQMGNFVDSIVTDNTMSCCYKLISS